MRKLLGSIRSGSGSENSESKGAFSLGGGLPKKKKLSSSSKNVTKPKSPEAGRLDEVSFSFCSKTNHDSTIKRGIQFGMLMFRLNPSCSQKNLQSKLDTLYFTIALPKLKEIASVYGQLDGISVYKGLGCALFHLDKDLLGNKKKIKVIKEKLSKVHAGSHYQELKDKISTRIIYAIESNSPSI